MMQKAANCKLISPDQQSTLARANRVLEVPAIKR
jgi:hypothetical protein